MTTAQPPGQSNRKQKTTVRHNNYMLLGEKVGGKKLFTRQKEAGSLQSQVRPKRKQNHNGSLFTRLLIVKKSKKI